MVDKYPYSVISPSVKVITKGCPVGISNLSMEVLLKIPNSIKRARSEFPCAAINTFFSFPLTFFMYNPILEVRLLSHLKCDTVHKN